MRKQVKVATVTVALVLFVMLAGPPIKSLLFSSANLNASGLVAGSGIGIYNSSNCTTEVSSINWGTLKPGEWKPYVVYIKNVGTEPLNLSMATSGWNPSNAQNYLTLTWDAKLNEQRILQPNASRPFCFTLIVAKNIVNVTAFSFTVTVTG